MNVDIDKAPAISPTEYDRSHVALQRAAAWVPKGWRTAYYAALVKLNAVRCRSREDLRLSGPCTDDGDLRITASSTDAVVDGILRKLRQRTAFTCEVCGRPGKHRNLGRDSLVLCPRCAGPRLLRDHIVHFKSVLDTRPVGVGARVYSYDEIPVQLCPIVPSNAWSQIRVQDGTSVHCIDANTLQKIWPRFESARRVAQQAIEASERD